MGLMLSDYSPEGSLRNRLRRERFALFLELVDSLPKPVKILDVGGTVNYWKVMGIQERTDLQVTLLNIVAEPVDIPRMHSLAGDARNLSQFEDGSFDVVFSNSVIEHVGDEHDQQRMADEIRRVGKNYFLQTPNYYFPIEPHFQCPLFHYLPEWLRVRLVKTFSLATYPRAKDTVQALAWVREIRILTPNQVKAFFPDANLVREKYFGLTKSLMAISRAK
jgi:hypothetical protein